MKYPIEDRDIGLDDGLPIFVPGKTPDEVVLRIQKETLMIQYKLLTEEMSLILSAINNVYFKDRHEDLKEVKSRIERLLKQSENLLKLHSDIERTL